MANLGDIYEIFKILEAAYPGFFRNLDIGKKQAMVGVWADTFADTPADVLTDAVRELTKTLKFPPNVAEIAAMIPAKERMDVIRGYELTGNIYRGFAEYKRDGFPTFLWGNRNAIDLIHETMAEAKIQDYLRADRDFAFRIRNGGKCVTDNLLAAYEREVEKPYRDWKMAKIRAELGADSYRVQAAEVHAIGKSLGMIGAGT